MITPKLYISLIVALVLTLCIGYLYTANKRLTGANKALIAQINELTVANNALQASLANANKALQKKDTIRLNQAKAIKAITASKQTDVVEWRNTPIPKDVVEALNAD